MRDELRGDGPAWGGREGHPGPRSRNVHGLSQVRLDVPALRPEPQRQLSPVVRGASIHAHSLVSKQAVRGQRPRENQGGEGVDEGNDHMASGGSTRRRASWPARAYGGREHKADESTRQARAHGAAGKSTTWRARAHGARVHMPWRVRAHGVHERSIDQSCPHRKRRPAASFQRSSSIVPA